MTTFTVRVTENVQVGIRKIGQTLLEITDEEIEAGLEGAAKEARGGWPDGGIRGYDVELTRNGEKNYVRTGNLGRETSWEREGRSFRIVSNAYSRRTGQAYNVGVIGDAQGSGQWGIHAKRWPLLAEVGLKWAKTMIDNLKARVKSDVETIKI